MTIKRLAPLRQLDHGIWLADRPQRFHGLEVGTRMTVIRLADGSLLLHSPVELDFELRCEIDRLGRVRLAVAPNRVHPRRSSARMGLGFLVGRPHLQVMDKATGEKELLECTQR